VGVEIALMFITSMRTMMTVKKRKVISLYVEDADLTLKKI
jgi:hypothetical protein